MNRTIAIIVLILMATVVVIFGVWPRYQGYAEDRSAAETLEQELFSREAYFTNLSEMNEQFGQYEGEIAKILAAIPEDPMLPALYQFMQQLSASSGLVMGSVDVTPGTASGDNIEAKPIEISLSLAGSYEAFKAFLANIETFPRILEIRSVNFAAAEIGTDFAFNVRLQAFSS